MSKKRHILIISDRSIPEIAGVERALKKIGEPVFRLDTTRLAQGFISVALYENGSGYLKDGKKTLDVKDIKAVWFTSPFAPVPVQIVNPKERAFAKEELKALLENLYQILPNAFWMNDVRAVMRADNKALQLNEARKAGLSVPPTCVTNNPVAARNFINSRNEKVIYKPIRFPYFLEEYDRKSASPIISVIPTSVVGPEHKKKLRSIATSGGIFQPLIDKDYELRVTIVGNHVFTTRIDSQLNKSAMAKTDWRRGEISKRTLGRYSLPSSVTKKCLRLMKNLSLVYGAMDFIKTKSGKYVFLEVNCSGSFNWVEKITKFPVSESIASCLSDAKVHNLS